MWWIVTSDLYRLVRWVSACPCVCVYNQYRYQRDEQNSPVVTGEEEYSKGFPFVSLYSGPNPLPTFYSGLKPKEES